MRFRKSVKICKGVRLNFSASGISTTVGVKGFSVNSGSRGTYLNTGIPGTGLYDRKRIGGSASRSTQKSTTVWDIKIRVNDDGTYAFYHDGILITDDALIGKIKRSATFKEQKAQLEALRRDKLAQGAANFNQGCEEIIQIVRHAEEVRSASDAQQELAGLVQEKYQRASYTVSAPSKEKLTSLLQEEAKDQVSSVAFWSVKKRREAYVAEQLEPRYAKLLADWEKGKADFEAKEDQHESNANAMYEAEYKQKADSLKAFLDGDEEYINASLDQWLGELELPLDFSVQYDYSNGTVMLDLDLPEIEDLPDEVATQMANGTVKQKKKSASALREDYAHCVFGFAVFFASHIFNIAAPIKTIAISGYTQRRDKQGDVVDDYVYSIIFNREQMEHIDLCDKDPIEFSLLFENRCNISKTFMLKAITPYSSEQIFGN